MTRKFRYGMSAQLRSGGGGGMHTSGYDGAQFDGGGGGGAGGTGGGAGGGAGGGGGGGAAVISHVKPRIGCSSMPLRATPVWPWRESKKATPVTTACLQSCTFFRAWAIWRRRRAVAFAVHPPAG